MIEIGDRYIKTQNHKKSKGFLRNVSKIPFNGFKFIILA